MNQTNTARAESPCTRNRARQNILRQSKHLLLLTFLFTLLATAQVPDSQKQVNNIPTSAFEIPSQSEVDHAIALATNYLEHACGPDGRFVYRINIGSGQQSHSYNIVRHAGAIYALAILQRSKQDKQTVDTMVRAASFLRQNYIGPGVHPNQLVVWSRPLPQTSVADLGATGLGLVALTAVYEIRPGSVQLEQLQALGRFLLFLQRDDGGFVSKYSVESGPDKDFESLYYPGEAALGLIYLYETDHSPVWLNAAAKALSFLARSRAKLSEVPPDHWALIATAKLLPYYPQSASPASKEELIQHATQICRTLTENQLRNPANSALDGSFDSTGRIAPTATRMEGLLAALEFLPRGSLRDQINDTVDHGIAFLLRAQIHDGPYSGGMPGAYLQGAPESVSIRIDFVQHAICAWLRYKQQFQSLSAVEYSPSKLHIPATLHR